MRTSTAFKARHSWVDIPDKARKDALDLSAFPNLSVFRISRDGSKSPMILATLFILAFSSVRRVRIDLMQGYPALDEAECGPLDAILLSTLPNPPTIEFEVVLGGSTYNTAMKSFPRLKSRDMVSCIHCGIVGNLKDLACSCALFRVGKNYLTIGGRYVTRHR